MFPGGRPDLGFIDPAVMPGGLGANIDDVAGTAANRVAAPIKPLTDVKFEAYDLTGKRVDKSDAMKRLEAGGLVLIAGDNRLPDSQYLKMFRGDLLVLVSPELVNAPTRNQDAGSAS